MSQTAKDFWVPSVSEEKGKIELFSKQYYAACTFGGIAACAPTHSLVTPLDLVKCRRQVNSGLYSSNIQAWKTIVKSEGLSAVYRGFIPTFVGYGLQGAGKYGFYEFFKKQYGDIAGDKFMQNYNTAIYLAASASAEFLADLALCPFEALKVRTQTTMPSLSYSAILKQGGISQLYSGLVPLWCRQIPYTMVKFASFEKVVETMYSFLPKSKNEYSKLSQTGVSFASGYVAGILCAVVSHPADVLVSLVNAERKSGESMGSAVGRIYSRIGFAGLWNGLPIRIFMVGTLTGFQWLIYDSFKIYVGLPTTGGH